MRNSRRSSTDCAQQPPRRMRDGPDDRTDSRKHHRDASAPPARSIQGIQGIRTIRNIRNIRSIRSIRVRRHPRTATAEQAKGEPSEGSPFACWSGKRDSHSRCARAVPRIMTDTPGPWKGRFEVAGAESSMTRHTKQKGESLKILPFALERKTGLGPATSTLARLRSTN